MVSEIVEPGPVAHRLPGVEGARVGLARLHDRWIPVVELANAIEDAPRLDPDAPDAVLLVLGRDRGRLGLRVQDPGEVVATGAKRVQDGRSGDLLELDGELVHYVDPAALVACRAELLAGRGGPMEENRAAAEPLRVLTFQLGDEEFGIDVLKVFEVVPVPEVRSLPKAPEFVEGVAEVRDSIVPVIDMRKRFGLPERGKADPARLMIVAMGESRAGLVVDVVPGVIPLPEEAVTPPPDFFRGLAGRYLEGLAKQGDRLIIMLNIGEILSSKEKIALEKMMKSKAKAAAASDAAARAKRKKRAASRTRKKRGG